MFKPEEYFEDEKRVKGKDTKGHLRPFVPVDEIPDFGSINIEEKIDKKLLKKDVAEEPEDYEQEEYERTDYEEKTPEDIGLIVKRHTAHAGPEFLEQESEKGIDFDEREKEIEKETEEAIIAPKKIKSYTNDSIYKKFIKAISGKVAKGKENLKTKKIIEKGEIRKALHNRENWRESGKKMDPLDVLSDNDLLSGE